MVYRIGFDTAFYHLRFSVFIFNQPCSKSSWGTANLGGVRSRREASWGQLTPQAAEASHQEDLWRGRGHEGVQAVHGGVPHHLPPMATGLFLTRILWGGFAHHPSVRIRTREGQYLSRWVTALSILGNRLLDCKTCSCLAVILVWVFELNLPNHSMLKEHQPLVARTFLLLQLKEC